MNIVVQTASGRIIVRPDTTWEKDNENLYVPDFVNSLSWSPVLTVRICKPGRSVSAKFASRYYNSIGMGVLLYPDELLLGGEEGYACASCLDHTSFIPSPELPSEIANDIKIKISLDGKEIFENTAPLSKEMIDKAMENATKYCYVRIGDILSIELCPRMPLCTRQMAHCRVTGGCNDMLQTDFEIIF